MLPPCGTGGLASFLSRRLRCQIHALDHSERAIVEALARRTTGASVEYTVADFEATGLPSESTAAIYSIDALYLAIDPRSALSEARRVLRPGGLMVFTTYSSPGASEASPATWCDAAESAGLHVVACLDITSRWRLLMRRKHEVRVQLRDDVHRVLGERAPVELQVSEAMIGYGQSSFIDATHRFEFRLAR